MSHLSKIIKSLGGSHRNPSKDYIKLGTIAIIYQYSKGFQILLKLETLMMKQLVMSVSSKFFISPVEKDNPHLPYVIQFAVGKPTHNKIQEVITSYQRTDNQLFGAYINNNLIGVIGLKSEAQKVIVRHISVLPEFRGCGVGTLLLNHVKAQYYECKIIAETDEESEGFYRKSGFTCDPFQGNHGNLRFSCECNNSKT